VKLIDEADKYVYFAIYFFTKENIASALIRAKERGLIVWGITDRGASNESNKEIVNSLKSAGIKVETQRHLEGIMHVKAIVTDKAYASGSYNWTASATVANDEVLEIGKNNAIRKKYLKIVQQLLVNNSKI
jgi:phosphatidylserine/phosphatidylglycerophosphate/cardiolipin synthase-like enzyme